MREPQELPEEGGGSSITYQSSTSECLMRITTKGQVTIPLAVRETLGLLPHTEVEFTIRGDTAVLMKAGTRRKGHMLIDYQRARGRGRLTTDKILAMTLSSDPA